MLLSRHWIFTDAFDRFEPLEKAYAMFLTGHDVRDSKLIPMLSSCDERKWSCPKVRDPSSRIAGFASDQNFVKPVSRDWFEIEDRKSRIARTTGSQRGTKVGSVRLPICESGRISARFQSALGTWQELWCQGADLQALCVGLPNTCEVVQEQYHPFPREG
jgi:hypothetical protein